MLIHLASDGDNAVAVTGKVFCYREAQTPRATGHQYITHARATAFLMAKRRAESRMRLTPALYVLANAAGTTPVSPLRDSIAALAQMPAVRQSWPR
jgi:hypothetical protein